MRIAVCDDEPKLLEEISGLLNEYKDSSDSDFTYDAYTNAIDLIAAMSKTKYDALILDIVMPGFSGMEAAHEIRDINSAIDIIFLTSSPEFAVESYRIHAFDYLMKPVVKAELNECLDRLSEKHLNDTSTLTINTPKKVISIPFSSIEFISVSNRTIEFNLYDGSTVEITGHLNDYEKLILDQPGYIKVHRSFIVNLARMKSIVDKDLTSVSGKSIPIARGLFKETRQAFMQFAANQ